jgi:hypothetical protein
MVDSKDQVNKITGAATTSKIIKSVMPASDIMFFILLVPGLIV